VGERKLREVNGGRLDKGETLVRRGAAGRDQKGVTRESVRREKVSPKEDGME
jgi:hypothetical protein